MLRRILVAAVLLISLAATLAAPAHAEASAACVGRDASVSGCSEANVSVEVGSDGSATSVSAKGKPVCRFDGKVIPCSDGGASWSSGHGCYVKLSDPQPAKSEAVWQGHTDGAVYECRLPDGVGGSRHLSEFWSATAPSNPQQVLELAARAVASLRLRAIPIGMAPTPTSIDPNSVGVVGLPNWMWVKNPAGNTWGPTSGSASDGALTVTVHAQAEQTTWTMGDGSAPIVCTSAGTPYAASYGRSESPTCGYKGYQKQGSYTVTAVTHWGIDYESNVGISGTLTLDLTSSAALTIAEQQTTAT